MPDQQQSIVIVEDDAGMRKAIERLLRAGVVRASRQGRNKGERAQGAAR